MKFINYNLISKVGVATAFLIASHLSAFSQRNAPVHNPTNKTALENLDGRAQSFVEKNLNRFGLDKLKEYDITLDSSYSSELRDTLALMEKTYLTKSSNLQQNLQTQNGKIQELSAQKVTLSDRYNKLLRTAAFAFLFWLLIVFLFMQFKRRKIRNKTKVLDQTNSELRFIKHNSSLALTSLNKIGELKNKMLKLKEETELLNNVSIELEENNSPNNKWNSELTNLAQSSKSTAEMEWRLSNAYLSVGENKESEKESLDINTICEEYLNIASRGIRIDANEFQCQITNDFEKNLPQIKVNRSEIGNLLLNVLNNAFHSVEEKYKKGIKGYQPKVAMSTRILPRFLQIRIKDNGLGMPDNVLQNATTPFFTTHTDGKGAGLGLSEAQKIMTELHKGEIKIESENGNSTDVYIKFFI